MNKEKTKCPECGGHGGTYESISSTGDIYGIPCETCNKEAYFYDEDRSEYVVWARASKIGKDKI